MLPDFQNAPCFCFKLFWNAFYPAKLLAFSGVDLIILSSPKLGPDEPGIWLSTLNQINGICLSSPSVNAPFPKYTFALVSAASHSSQFLFQTT